MSAFSVGPVESCERARDGQHRYDWGGSDMTVLTSYGCPSDHQVVVRLSRCRSCGRGLLAVAPFDADDNDLGVLLAIEGTEVGEG